MLTIDLILLGALIVAGLYMAWNIGANDVANAMGTSVGSGALTLRQAVILAAIFEFLGAFFFGSKVSETIQSDILSPTLFSYEPYLYVLGMLSSLLAAGVWLQIASYFGWPVSTTHSIIGAVVGFGIVGGGFDAVEWGWVLSIVASWILSPLLGGFMSLYLFSLIRDKVLYSDCPLEATKNMTPYFVFALCFLLFFTLILTGSNHLGFGIEIPNIIALSLVLSILGAVFSSLMVQKLPHEEEIHIQLKWVEKIFSKLQIFSACIMAFAHGSNDVANAIGPMTGSIQILLSNQTDIQVSVPNWALALGGFGIVLGLATWGWRVIMTIGKKITELTPTRGFSAELSAAIVVLIASKFGMPISATHTLVGAVLGVGLARGIGAINLAITRDILASWVVTVPAGALLSILFYLTLKLSILSL